MFARKPLFALPAAIVGALALAAAPALAAPTQQATSGGMVVTAQVLQKCKIALPATLTVPSINWLNNAQVSANATVTLNCTKGSTGVLVGMLAANNNGVGQTYLKGATGNADKLNYSLWQNAGFSTPWDNATNRMNVTTAFSSYNTPVTSTVYLTIPVANQDVNVGTYTDTITATVWF